jgi:GDPmannose 4,6-dehydratase
MKPRQGVALIFGITGQDRAYLAELLMKRGLEVHGTSRDKEASSCANLHRLGVYVHITLHSVVLSDFRSVVSALNGVKPTYIYNLAAQSSVGLSFEQPVATIDSIMHGTINVLEAMRFLALEAKLYNASSCECFGQPSQDQAADDSTTFLPQPYAFARLHHSGLSRTIARRMGCLHVRVCRSNESPIRRARYVTQKIVRGAMAMAAGRSRSLTLGRLDSNRGNKHA